jgi:DNA-binding MarR family transcriptional regulator
MSEEVMTACEATEEKGNDIDAVSETLGRLRLLIGRRIIGRLTIDTLVSDLELSHLDVIDAVRRSKGEVTVGAIAELMMIDPSRGSRLVSELVQKGMLRRVASQEDARRTVVELTEAAHGFIRRKGAVKRALIENLLADWPEADKARFAGLFARFVDAFEQQARGDQS